MAFEFDNLFNEDGFRTEFLPHEKVKKGGGLKLELNRDIISLDFIEQAGRFMKEMLPIAGAEAAVTENAPASAEAALLEVKKSIDSSLQVMEGVADSIRQYARILGGKPGENVPNDRVIKSWDLVRNKRAVPVSYEELVSWKYSLLQKLFNFCVFEAQNVEKKKDGQSAKP